MNFSLHFILITILLLMISQKCLLNKWTSLLYVKTILNIKYKCLKLTEVAVKVLGHRVRSIIKVCLMQLVYTILLRKKKKKLCIMFVELEKNYDKVLREVLKWMLMRKEVLKTYINVIENMYDSSCTSVRYLNLYL